MRQMLLALIGITLLQSVCILLADDAKHKAILQLTGGIAMVIILLESILSFDYDAYASSLRREQNDVEMTDAAQSETMRLNRLFIEQECRAYILDKASSLGADLTDAAVTLSWDTDGFWYPSAAELTIPAHGERSAALADAVQTDLGISSLSLTWREESGDAS